MVNRCGVSGSGATLNELKLDSRCDTVHGYGRVHLCPLTSDDSVVINIRGSCAVGPATVLVVPGLQHLSAHTARADRHPPHSPLRETKTTGGSRRWPVAPHRDLRPPVLLGLAPTTGHHTTHATQSTGVAAVRHARAMRARVAPPLACGPRPSLSRVPPRCASCSRA